MDLFRRIGLRPCEIYTAGGVDAPLLKSLAVLINDLVLLCSHLDSHNNADQYSLMWAGALDQEITGIDFVQTPVAVESAVENIGAMAMEKRMYAVGFGTEDSNANLGSPSILADLYPANHMFGFMLYFRNVRQA
jgi:hypothetical protein